MAAEFYSDFTRHEAPQKRSLLVRLLDGCMLLASIVFGVALALTLVVPFVNPSRVFFFPLLGLIAPAVYVAAVILALYWIVRWQWIRACVLIGVILLASFDVPLFYRVQFRRTYGEPDYGRGTFRMMTYNVRGFYGDDRGSSTDRIAALLDTLDLDLVCLQEFNTALARRSSAMQQLLERYSVVGSHGRSDAGPMVILSKFPIVQSDTIPESGDALWADLRIGEDVVRIFSNHLHTTEIKAYDDEFITQRLFLSDSTRWARFRSIAGRHRRNSELRAQQVDRIASVIAATPTRYLVCGDFNDTPVSYVYRTMARGTKDAFSECGTGYSHTFRGFFNTLRIDYVLHSGGLEALSYEVLPVSDCSDHLPVVVRLQKSEFSEPTSNQ